MVRMTGTSSVKGPEDNMRRDLLGSRNPTWPSMQEQDWDSSEIPPNRRPFVVEMKRESFYIRREVFEPDRK